MRSWQHNGELALPQGAIRLLGGTLFDKKWLLAYAGSFSMIALALAAGLLMQQFISLQNVALVFLTAVLLSAISFGRWPALAASVAGALIYNFFFIPPVHTFHIANAENVVTFFFFTFAALVVSNLTHDIERARVAAQTEKLRSALLASVSHDLKTPLASILGSASSLKTYGKSLGEDSRDQLVNTILEEAERLNRFMTDLLDMTRLEAGAIRPNLEVVDLSDVIGSAARRATAVLGPRALDIVLEPDLPPLIIDPVLFDQVLFNLLDNAAKYSRQGTFIRIEAHREGRTVVVTVLDQGDGIPEGNLEKIFDKFDRGNRGDRQRAGSGLGLAICRGFVAVMGGTIEAANRDDRNGAVFTIRLPAGVSTEMPAEVP